MIPIGCWFRPAAEQTGTVTAGGGRRSGRVSEADHALWTEVIRTARPLHINRAPEMPITPKMKLDSAENSVAALNSNPPSPNKRSARNGEDVQQLGPATPGLDRRTAQRLRKGKLTPQARLDLHGMTMDRAHGRLNGFILDARARGLRCVLVITGKGKPREDGWRVSLTGVLRDAVPRWLSLPPLAPLVVGVFPANQRHGGGGAFYVYLKKER